MVISLEIGQEIAPQRHQAELTIGSAQPKKIETGTLYVASRTCERDRILLTTESPEKHEKGKCSEALRHA
jgi:hypothetical protein